MIGVMKFNKATKFRFCKPKYQLIWGSLIFVGCVLVVIIRGIFPNAPDWIGETGLAMAIAGLVVFGVGTIAARREWEAKREDTAKEYR